LFLKALRRIFRLWQWGESAAVSAAAASTSTGPGAGAGAVGLSDAHLNAFQQFCFGRRLQPMDLSELKAIG
jgi:hypothetical protein